MTHREKCRGLDVLPYSVGNTLGSRVKSCLINASPCGFHRFTVNYREILRQAGLSARACRLSEAMTLNRLIFPLSEHAMPDGMRRTALADILGADFSTLHDDALYRNLDRLHPNRERIEAALAARRR